MTANPAIRRSLVTLAVVVTLFAAGATVRAASLWASSAVALANPPASASSIEAALRAEQARSAALRAQLDQLTGASQQLDDALAAANDRLTTDQAIAADLRASLDAAKTKLATLEAQLKSSRGSSAGSTTRIGTSGSSYGGDDSGVDD